jgi:hypothetical protein
MSNRTAVSAAYAAGRKFAEELNEDPREAQNWGHLGRHDDLPPEDYSALAREHGDVTQEMSDSYKDDRRSGPAKIWQAIEPRR